MKKIILIAIMLFCSLKALAQESAYVMEELIKNAPAIGNEMPSNRVSKLIGNEIVYGEHTYELRFFFFEDINNKLRTSFKEFVKQQQLMKLQGKIMDHGYGPLVVFMAPETIKQSGIHFTISLRKIEPTVSLKNWKEPQSNYASSAGAAPN